MANLRDTRTGLRFAVLVEINGDLNGLARSGLRGSSDVDEVTFVFISLFQGGSVRAKLLVFCHLMREEFMPDRLMCSRWRTFHIYFYFNIYFLNSNFTHCI